MRLGKPTALVTTLGGQPPIVTLALAALLAQDVPIAELIALHLSPLFTPDVIRRQADEEAIMHLPPSSGFRLIRMPMLP